MDVFYFFECDFPSVYLVNGVFFDTLSRLKSDSGDSLYITVLPLDAVYLPYTVRIGGGQIYANSSLTVIYRLRRDRCLVRFLPRFNYVYSPVKHEPPKKNGSAVTRLFDALKERDTAAARALLTPELSASVDDNSLLEFFDGYAYIVENNGYVPSAPGSFFLVPDGDETASLFKAEYRGGLIDNIGEIDK